MAKLGDFQLTRRFLTANYPLLKEEPLALEIREPAGENPARVELAVAHERTWILISVPVCRESEVNAMAALRFNATLAVGTLAVDDGLCVMRHTLLMATLTEEALSEALQRLWKEAARLRAGRRDEAVLQEIFTNLVD